MSEPLVPSARDAYAALGHDLQVEFDGLRLRRVRGVTFPAWRTEATPSGAATFVSLQIDTKATDAYSGGGFRVEVEHSLNAKPALGLNGRALFFQLLTHDELRPLADHQDAFVRTLTRPPTEHVDLYPPGAVREMYLSYFEPQGKFDAVRSWLRYRTLDDLASWAVIVKPVISILVDRGSQLLRPDERVLGKGALV